VPIGDGATDGLREVGEGPGEIGALPPQPAATMAALMSKPAIRTRRRGGRSIMACVMAITLASVE
jgi:hypothetical protein